VPQSTVFVKDPELCVYSMYDVLHFKVRLKWNILVCYIMHFARIFITLVNSKGIQWEVDSSVYSDYFILTGTTGQNF